MLNDSYVEYAVKTKPEKNFYLGVTGGILCIFLGVFLLLFDLIGIAIVLIGICLIVFFGKTKNIEYEYIITNGNVEISAIYGASRRAVKKQFDATLIKMVCPGDSNRIEGQQFDKRYDYTSKDKEAGSVAVVIERDDKKELVLLELNDKCIEHMKTYLRHKVYDL
ncbi:MAG: hypothetical protein IJ661_06150 [Lachnospiraceae bacterium]|nr:hypothetical protein [Lachnospiraceae bacterium]